MEKKNVKLYFNRGSGHQQNHVETPVFQIHVYARLLCRMTAPNQAGSQ